MTNSSFQHLAIVGISLAVNATSQVMSRRCGGAWLSVFRSALLGFLCGAIALAALEIGFLFSGSRGSQICWLLFGDTIMYTCAGYCWLHYVNIGEASVRLRMARELMDAEPRGLTAGELAKRYGVGHIIDARLDRLAAAGELAFRDGRYFLQKPKMLFVARVFTWLRRIVLDDSFLAVRATKAAERFCETGGRGAATRE